MDGAAWLAEVTGVENYIIASQEKVGMAIGNGIGSVICNTALITAISLIFLPVKIERKDFVPKALLLISSVMALFLLSLNGFFTVSGAVILLVILTVYIFENIKSARNNLVDNGGEIARNWGVAEAIIGVTIVAIGTSLPELVTAVAAVVKRHPSMSIGNVIGANIIDTSLILSVCSFIYGGNLPVSVQNIRIDFPVAIVVSLIAVVPTIIQQKISRWQGIVMITIYIAYLIMVTTEPEWIFGY